MPTGFILRFNIFFVFLCCATISSQAMGQIATSKALYLDGNRNYLDIPDAKFLNFDPAVDLTVEFRFKTFTQQPFSLFNKWSPDHCFDTEGKGWLLELNRRPCEIGDFCFGSEDGLAAVPQIGATRLAYLDCATVSKTERAFEVVHNRWVHFAISFETRTEFTRVTTNFFDGDTLRTSLRTVVNSEFITTGLPLYIGGMPEEVDSTLYMRGLVDEVRIWRTVRSRSQLLATMNDTLGPEYYVSLDSGLVAYYRFEEFVDRGVGEDLLQDDLLDLSFNGHHADIIGTAQLVDSDFVTSVESGAEYAPASLRLKQNHPNPFNPTTQITFELSQWSPVSLTIYNTAGQLIRRWTDQTLGPGQHTVDWNGRDDQGRLVASGVYLYSITAPGFVAIKKMVKLK